MYCRLPDGVKEPASFGVDHYRPKKPFIDLITTYSNLFYACNCCNSRKQNFWPTPAQLREKKFIPNPCDHVMFEHLQYKQALVTFKSPAGLQTDEILDLNDPESVKYREFVLGMIASLENDVSDTVSIIEGIDQKLAQSPEQDQVLETEKASREARLEKLRSHLARLGAT